MKSKAFIAFLITILWACNDAEDMPLPAVVWEPASVENQFIFNTYKILGFNDNKLSQRWDKTEVYYWFDESNAKTEVIKTITDSVFTQINNLSSSTKFIKTTDEEKANITLYSGRSDEFEAKYKLNLGKELEVGGTAFTSFENAQGRIKKVVIWVTSIFPINDRKLITRHEIGHAVGFTHVSTQKSIMWKTFDTTYDGTDYTALDKIYLKMHYDPRVKSGMTIEQLTPVLKDYLK